MHPEEPFLDPYHTRLSLTTTSMFPPPESTGGGAWTIEPLDLSINAKLFTAQWARDHISYTLEVYMKKTRVTKFVWDVGVVRKGNCASSSRVKGLKAVGFWFTILGNTRTEAHGILCHLLQGFPPPCQESAF